MVSDAPEQIGTPTDQVDAQSLGQVLPASETAVLPVPAAATDDAAPAAQTFDLTTDAGIKAAIEANPQLRGFFDKTKADTENTVRQRLANEWERSKGSTQRASEYHKSVIARLTAGEDPETIAQETPGFVTANDRALRADLLRGLTTQAIDLAVSPEEKAALQSLLDETDDPDAMTKITSATLQALTGRIKRQALDDLDPEQLADHPKFKDWIAAYKTREAEAELNAREIERNRIEAPPQTPTGQGAQAMSKSQLDSMTPAARLAYLATLSDEQRSAAWDLAMSE